MNHFTNFKNTILAAAFSLQFACGEENLECFQHNETTQSINQVTDGEITSYDTIFQPTNQISSEPALDLVNETHQLATEPLPDNLSVTRVPRYCVTPGIAYSYYGGDQGYEPGIYFASDFDPITAVDILNHEIGHFQPAGKSSEVIAELNAYEQDLMAYPLFATTEDNDLTQWAYVNSGIDNYLSHLSDAVDNNPNGSSLPRYPNADIFLLEQLSNPSMDFRTLRDEIIQRDSEGTLQGDIQQGVDNFWERYDLAQYDENQLAQLADLVLTMAAAFIRELDYRFGEEAAQLYIDAHSLFPYEPVYRIPVLGLDERVCYLTNLSSTIEARFYCARPERYELREVTCDEPLSLDFCCVQLLGGAVSKSLVHAEGGRFVSEDTTASGVVMDGLLWDAVDIIQVTSEEIIRLEERCR